MVYFFYKRKLLSKRYLKTASGRAMARKSSAKWNANNKEKKTAHSKFWNALKQGNILKQPCEYCGNKKAHAHHEHYSRPFDVIWFCHFHHMEHHKLKGEMRRVDFNL